jgi:ribosomal protein L11 methyltransferase
MASGTSAAWCVRLLAPAPVLPLIELALAQLGGALVTDGPDGDGNIPVSVFLAAAPDRPHLTALLAAAAAAAGVAMPETIIEALPETDWVAENQKALPAIQAGPFYVYGAHVTAPPPAGSIPLLIEANVAFGTGRHESTHGCLLALDALAAERRIGKALDMGCGSGILAIAMAKLWGGPVLAVDSDADSVRVTKENAAINDVAAFITAVHGDGYNFPAVGDGGPYDVIVENILADAVCAMAPQLKRHLAPGGCAILSGLLADQAAEVMAAHAPLRLKREWRLGDWVTLVLEK